MTRQDPTEADFLAAYDITRYPQWSRTADIAAFTIRDGALCIVLVTRAQHPFRGQLALPGGFVPPDESSLDAAYRELADETGVDKLPAGAHLEQLATYDTPGRDPRGPVSTTAHICFAAGMPDPVAGSDAASARWWPVADLGLGLGYDDEPDDPPTLAFDHADIVRDAVERARAKLEWTTLATSFVPSPFSISELRRVYEATWGTALDRSNFSRKAQAVKGWLIPATSDPQPPDSGGPPARLFRAGTAERIAPPLERPDPR